MNARIRSSSPRVLIPAAFALLAAAGYAIGSDERAEAFAQLGELLPTPNSYRTASGAPGHEYWQQKVDYTIDVALDEDKRRLTGTEAIVYANHSPDVLRYLWVQVDANIYAPDSHAVLTSLAPALDETSYGGLRRTLERDRFDGSAEIRSVTTADGKPLAHTIVDTMMRVDLPEPLAPGETFRFGIDWSYAINDAGQVSGRTGFEHFDKDGNDIFEIAQWFPRLCAYTDYQGWQNKQFLGRGEFTLEFGDYRVRITAPEDHVVAATGELQNPEEVLDVPWQQRLDEARHKDRPSFIVTPEEAKANEAERATGTKTWEFHAENVRDFAWASSRKFIWDALLVEVAGKSIWAMSYYPNEGEPLWSKYSTQAVAHTLEVYSDHAFPYPYPKAISVNGPVGGMEYPMICFNGPRPEEDGTYSSRTKYGLIGVVIHEVGHNWFPMIVNSDERQWTWMDEGLNTFCQYLAEQKWQEDYPSWRGEPKNIVGYMADANSVPIMTNSESILQFGNNAYAKPATALNVLRESVLGRELFDFAFREYATRWMFKRPQPADLFRTLEDATAVDLDWFWRGWFFTTEHVDLALGKIQRYRIDTQNPDIERAISRRLRDDEPTTLAQARNASIEKRVERYPELADFYNTYDELDVTSDDLEAYDKLLAGLKDEDKALLDSKLNFYVVEVQNEGGLPMPVVLELHYTDGATDEVRVPVEVWRQGEKSIQELIMSEREVESIVLDPHLETADTDLENNHWPTRIEDKNIELRERDARRGGPGGGKNPMQEAREREEKAAKKAAEASADAGGESAPVEAGGGAGGAGSGAGGAGSGAASGASAGSGSGSGGR